jgi:hypothetical protein
VEDALDADAAARVLRRARDLAASHAPNDDPDGAGVSGQALVEAASEVGIDPDSVRDALALERFDADRPEPQNLDRLAGPGSVLVEHVVPRTAADAIDDTEAWLTVTHRMRCIRTTDGRLECRPRRGWVARVGRSVAGATGEVTITSIDRITVAAQPLTLGATPDQPRTLVRIVANRQGSRRRRVGVGSVAGVMGVGAAVAGVAGSMLAGPVIAVPLIAGGYTVARSGAKQADQIELELIRVLAAIDRTERPVGLIGRAARRARHVTDPRRP